MGVLDTFFYVFKSDTSQLQQGEAAAEKSVKKTTDQLNLQDKAAVKVSASFVDLAKSLAGAAAAYLSWAALKSVAIQEAEQTNAIADQARALYVNADALQAWQGAIVRAGGDVSGLNSTIEMLSQRTRDPLGALLRVADRFKGLNDRQADRLGSFLGLDKGTIELMRNGRDGLEKIIARQKELGTVTKEQIEAARKYRQQMNDLNTVMSDVRRRIMGEVLPTVTEWLAALEKIVLWIRANSNSVKLFFAVIAGVITAVLLPAIIRLGIAWGAATAAFIASPIGILITSVLALAAAFALVVDDIMAFEEGGVSVIGKLAERFPMLGQAVHDFVDVVKMLFEVWRAGFAFMTDLVMQPDKALSNLQTRLNVLLNAMTERFPLLAAVIRTAMTAVGTAINSATWIFEKFWDIAKKVWDLVANSAFGKAMGAVLGKVGEVAGAVTDAVVNAASVDAPAGTGRYTLPSDAQVASMRGEVSASVTAGKGQLVNEARNPMITQTSNSISNRTGGNRTTEVKIDKVEVQTQATDAEGISKSIGNTLQNQLGQAIARNDDGVAR